MDQLGLSQAVADLQASQQPAAAAAPRRRAPVERVVLAEAELRRSKRCAGQGAVLRQGRCLPQNPTDLPSAAAATAESAGAGGADMRCPTQPPGLPARRSTQAVNYNEQAFFKAAEEAIRHPKV